MLCADASVGPFDPPPPPDTIQIAFAARDKTHGGRTANQRQISTEMTARDNAGLEHAHHGMGRAVFDPAELALVLSHYDLGTIESITEFGRGSHRNPKAGIVCTRGKFLLKRRSLERAGQERVRFSHRVQGHLDRAGFPVARIHPARDGSRTFVQWQDHLYELFEFVPGQTFSRSVAECRAAGRTLARFHEGTREFVDSLAMPDLGGDYHDAASVRSRLGAIGTTLTSHDSFSGDEAELASLVQSLMQAYDDAAEAVNGQGFEDWPLRLIHSDWHPGNILFRDGDVLAVIDYDALRFSRCVVDVATGSLQFSIIAGNDPVDWPESLDVDRYSAFVQGYESIASLSSEERLAVPYLMCEALIAECVAPIAATGSMGRWSGFRILQMVSRKLKWMRQNAEMLSP